MLIKTFHPQSKLLFDRLIEDDGVRRLIDPLRTQHRETYEHSLRVGLLSIDLGHDNELHPPELLCLGCAGLLHDVEKARIPGDILSKNGTINSEETRIMEEHPRLAFRECLDMGWEVVAEIVVAHHEYRKNPYPRKGIERRQDNRFTVDRRKNKVSVSMLAQIVAVVDMYDALSSRRSYKEPISAAKTEGILMEQFTGEKKYISQVLRRSKL
jgi:HD-GYP domain-containing protein (c-di-GMP phosphodiesterase class II)